MAILYRRVPQYDRREISMGADYNKSGRAIFSVQAPIFPRRAQTRLPRRRKPRASGEVIIDTQRETLVFR